MAMMGSDMMPRRAGITTLRRDYIFPFLVFILINALHLLGLKIYEPWLQVILLWTHHLDLDKLSGNFHFSRLMVSAPGLWLEDRFPDHGFSLYVSIFLFLCALFFSKSHRIVAQRQPQLWTWLLLIPLFFLMNGRGAIGWAGWLLCVHACLRVIHGLQPWLSGKTVFQITVGLIFSTVSSGVFVCSITMVALFGIQGIFRRRQRRRFSFLRLPGLVFLAALLPVILYFAVSYLLDAIDKALQFYGGGLDGLIRIAEHGIYSSIERFTVVHVVVLFILVVGGGAFLTSRLPARIGWSLITMIAIALFGGFFGLTILTLALPLIIIALGKLFRIRLDSGHPA